MGNGKIDPLNGNCTLYFRKQGIEWDGILEVSRLFTLWWEFGKHLFHQIPQFFFPDRRSGSLPISTFRHGLPEQGVALGIDKINLYTAFQGRTSHGNPQGNSTAYIPAASPQADPDTVPAPGLKNGTEYIDIKIGFFDQAIAPALKGGIQNADQPSFIQLAHARIQVRKIIVGGIGREINLPVVVIVHPYGRTGNRQ